MDSGNLQDVTHGPSASWQMRLRHFPVWQFLSQVQIVRAPPSPNHPSITNSLPWFLFHCRGLHQLNQSPEYHMPEKGFLRTKYRDQYLLTRIPPLYKSSRTRERSFRVVRGSYCVHNRGQSNPLRLVPNLVSSGRADLTCTGNTIARPYASTK